MLDLSLFLFVMAFLALGMRRPFIWVLAYLYIDILAPQKIGWTITPLLPISLIAFCAAFAGWLYVDDKTNARFTLRQGVMTALLIYCFYTTMTAVYPDAALEKWSWVWKALVFAIFLPLTLTTRLRLEGTALVMVLTVGAIIISAGIKTATGGGGYGNLYLFVNDNSNIYESSTLATVAIAIIPLIVWFNRFGTVFAPDWRVKAFSAALIFACLLIPIGTEARTGLVCIAVLAVLFLRDTKRRLTFIAAGAALGLVSLPFLPQTFYDRMATIGGHDGDESASTRVAVWEWTIDYARQHPFGGGFEIYRSNRFEYEMPVTEKTGNTTSVEYKEIVDEARAFHSAIFEMLGEQGWPGLTLWLFLHVTGLWQMERIRRAWNRRERPADGASDTKAWIGPLASALQYAQVIYLVGSLFQGIAYQPFILMLIGLQIALWSYVKRTESDTLARPRRRRKRGGTAEAVAGPMRDSVTAGRGALH